MILAPFAGQAFDDSAYGLPSIELDNWYIEEAPDRADKGARLIPVPGLKAFASGASGIVQGMEFADILSDGPFIVHANHRLERYNSAGQQVAQYPMLGSGAVTRFASSQIETVASTGEKAYIVGVTTAEEVVLPVGNGVITDIAEINQRHLYVEANSGRLWYSEVANAASIKADAFITAEDEPDELRAVRAYQGSIYAFGTRSIQILRPTTSESQPFQPSPGGTLPKGIVGRDAAVTADFGQFFVGNDHIVYRLDGYQAQRVSTHWIERRIQDLPYDSKKKISLTSHAWEGHTFLVLRLPDVGTWVYDAATGRWHRRSSYNRDTSIITAYQEAFGLVYAGDIDGNVWTLDRNSQTQGDLPMVRTASTLVPVIDNDPHVSKIVVEAQAGIGEGVNEKAEIMLRVSRDGRTWGDWQTGDMGRPGQYARRTVFGPFGRMEAPFFGVQIQCADTVPVTVTAVRINPERG